MSRLVGSLVLAACSLWASCILAAEFTLFDRPNVPVENYDSVVKRLRAGDIVVFSDGRRFQIQEFVGEGGTAKIFAIEPGVVMRIASSRKNLRYADQYGAAISQLAKAGVPTPVIDQERTIPGENVILERVTVEYDYGSFAEWAKRGGNFPGYEAAVDGLVDFAKRSAIFRGIGDLGHTNLVHTREKGWIALDALNYLDPIPVALEQAGDEKHCLWQVGNEWVFGKLPANVQERIRLAVSDTRKNLRSSCLELEAKAIKAAW